MPTKSTRKNAGPRRPRKTTRKKVPAGTTMAGAASMVSRMASTQLKQLRKTVQQLRGRLEKEAKARASDMALVQEAKKARDRVAGQLSSLRQQGEKLSKELRKALSDSERREAARQQALAKIGELREELGRKTEDLKRKSEELAKLARESAGRARDIIMSEAAPPTAPSESPQSPSGEESRQD